MEVHEEREIWLNHSLNKSPVCFDFFFKIVHTQSPPPFPILFYPPTSYKVKQSILRHLFMCGVLPKTSTVNIYVIAGQCSAMSISIKPSNHKVWTQRKFLILMNSSHRKVRLLTLFEFPPRNWKGSTHRDRPLSFIYPSCMNIKYFVSQTGTQQISAYLFGVQNVQQTYEMNFYVSEEK